jgi:uncharacterized membrane protein YedE/YeeE
MTAPLVFGQNVSLLLAIVLGFFFGISLERGGLGNPHKLVGVFYLRDFAVPKAMFTAIIVAALGLYLLSDIGLLDINRIWIVPTYFWPQLAGGALFGIGFVISGYCPGTAVAGLAGGRLDALVTMLGIGVGSLVFAVLYPSIEGFYLSSSMEGATLHKWLNINHWVVIVFFLIMAGGMFYIMEWYEKK